MNRWLAGCAQVCLLLLVTGCQSHSRFPLAFDYPIELVTGAEFFAEPVHLDENQSAGHAGA